MHFINDSCFTHRTETNIFNILLFHLVGFGVVSRRNSSCRNLPVPALLKPRDDMNLQLPLRELKLIKIWIQSVGEHLTNQIMDKYVKQDLLLWEQLRDSEELRSLQRQAAYPCNSAGSTTLLCRGRSTEKSVGGACKRWRGGRPALSGMGSSEWWAGSGEEKKYGWRIACREETIDHRSITGSLNLESSSCSSPVRPNSAAWTDTPGTCRAGRWPEGTCQGRSPPMGSLGSP